MTKRRGLVMAIIALLVAWGSLAAVLAVQAAGGDGALGPKLGLDLKGGFSVRLTAPEGTDLGVVEKAKDIMERRIAALGNVQEPDVRVEEPRSILVDLPGVTDRERALNAVGSTGQLSFRCVISRSQQPFVSPFFTEFGLPFPGQEDTTTTTLPDGTTTTTTVPPSDQPPPEPRCPTPTEPWTAPPDLPAGVDPATGLTIADDPTGEAWLLEEVSGTVYHIGPAALLGSDIQGGQAIFTGTGGLGVGQWAVDPDFTSRGSTAFEETTRQLAQFVPGDPRRQFAIVLDGAVVSAPQVNPDVDPVVGLDANSAIITIGSAEDPQAEAEDLATVLRYGALPVTFEADRAQAISATLGADSLRAGLMAGMGGLLLVGIAMMVYYRALGLITIVGLSVFGSMLLVAFSVLGETQGLTLTLAGVTGLVVSVGITSDSYIVYFERIKEEVRHGRSLRAAVDGAFPKAFRTILTADSVSFMGAVLLWLLAVGPVRGFAIALGMATIADVIVAYYFTRPAAAYLVRTRFGEGGAASVRGAVGHPAEAPT